MVTFARLQELIQKADFVRDAVKLTGIGKGQKPLDLLMYEGTFEGNETRNVLEVVDELGYRVDIFEIRRLGEGK